MCNQYKKERIPGDARGSDLEDRIKAVAPHRRCVCPRRKRGLGGCEVLRWKSRGHSRVYGSGAQESSVVKLSFYEMLQLWTLSLAIKEPAPSLSHTHCLCPYQAELGSGLPAAFFTRRLWLAARLVAVMSN